MTESPRTRLIRRTVVPLILLVSCPPIVIVLWMIGARFDGSIELFLSSIDVPTFLRLCPRPTVAAAQMLLVYAALELGLLVGLPGKTHLGPVTPAGNRPRYKLNGVAAYAVTHGVLGAAALLGVFRPAAVYDELGPMLVILTLSGLVLCVFLYWKGANRPSSSDAGLSGNPIFDYYWGVELHPTALGVSLKQYINCRLAMMGWSVIILSCLFKQYETTGAVSSSMMVAVGLQVVYIVKFFWWESGYFGSLDIMHDRFGFYIAWGVMAWLPCLYTLSTQFLVGHPVALPPWLAAGIFAFGVFAIWVNYDADAQRQRVRETKGETTVWGKKPEIMVARYVTSDGEERESLLLLSGWWGVARHFHYVAEITLALMWTVPAGVTHVLPYLYVIFLSLLLTERASRDDTRCREKYGEAWTRYCERVPYRIVPFVY